MHRHRDQPDLVEGVRGGDEVRGLLRRGEQHALAARGEEIAASSPLGRIGRPDDMAGVVVYLASRAGAYVTGAVIPVDGGRATTL